jgi:hypothetical protein
MGCDIHSFIDYEEGQQPDGRTGVFQFGTVHIHRDYFLFALMAGVRTDEPADAVVPPRGVPRLSGRTQDEFAMFVTDDTGGDPHYCTRETAEGYVKHGSFYLDPEKRFVSNPDWHTPSWLTVPELEEVRRRYREGLTKRHAAYQEQTKKVREMAKEHDPKTTDAALDEGWLTKFRPEEDTVRGSELTRLDAAIAAMKVLDGDTPGRSRLTFWFDN